MREWISAGLPAESYQLRMARSKARFQTTIGELNKLQLQAFRGAWGLMVTYLTGRRIGDHGGDDSKEDD